ncbi:MAG: D-alanyl-D-alanine carboxypeptidase, partial [Clostridia bacterium]|nr:D-alanyl-D-alanine carboxypeptidase [Clostridia bacterium]
MKKIAVRCCLVLIIMLCIISSGNTIYSVEASEKVVLVGAELTSAKSMCVLEKNTKKVFYEKNKDIQRANASTTKIVTAITVLENCENLEEEIIVNDLSVGVEGTSIYLRKGEKIKIMDLLYGLMLRSGNDSACALAYHVSGSIEDFAILMNETAKKAGAINSNFANPHGLDQENHYTTAYDLALITAYALNNDTFKIIVSTKQHTIKATNVSETRYLTNKNKLLRSLEGCCGVKTGFTSKAGRCLVSAVERNGMTLVCVVLNCGPMFEDSATLLNRGFDEYDWTMVVDKDKVIYNEYYLNNVKG